MANRIPVAIVIAGLSFLAAAHSGQDDQCSVPRAMCFGVNWKQATAREVSTVDVAARDRTSGWTPLHFAAEYSDNQVVAALLAKGADPSSRDIYGWTPLHVVAQPHRKKMITLPSGKTVPMPVHSPVTHTDMHEWESADIENKNLQDVVTANLLLDAGADPDAATSVYGQTPLHLVIHHDNGSELVDLLIDRGGEVDALMHKGWQIGDIAVGSSALHVAALVNYKGIYLKLLSYGGDAERQNDYKKTPQELMSEQSVTVTEVDK